MTQPKDLSYFVNYVLNLLSYRPRSGQEVSLRLKRKQATPSQIQQVLAKLKKLNLINDADFCSWWQRQRDQSRPRSARILALELYKKGVSKENIDATIDKSFATELSRAQSAFAKKFKSLPKKMDQQLRQKMIRFLASRGFSWEIIKQTIDPDAN